jgi:hypothetical protein
MSSTVANLPKFLNVVVRMEGGSELNAVLGRPKSKRVGDLMIRLKYTEDTYNLRHFYNYYTKRFNIPRDSGVRSNYDILSFLFVGDRSVKDLLASLSPAELAQVGQATVTAAVAATAFPASVTPAAADLASFEAAVRTQMVSGSASAVATATETATATATAEPRFKPLNPFGDNDNNSEPYKVTSVPLPPFPSVPKEERDKESELLKHLVLEDMEVLIASKREPKAVTLKAAAEAAAAAPTVPVTTGEHQHDCCCYAFEDEEVEPLLNVLTLPDSVRSQEKLHVRPFTLPKDCRPIVHIASMGLINVSLEPDGTFTFRPPYHSPIADLHSLEVLYLLSPQTSADRKEWEDRGRLDPLYALDQLALAFNPLMSLRMRLSTSTSTSATSTLTSTSTSTSTSTLTSTSATADSPQALLQKEKAKEAELRSEIALWTAIANQHQLNKELEKQLAALKESV